jgi:2,4-dienoyl-CoA reductase-like NADH-dependent reductase (Old Yellow Enzyme family)
VNSDALDGPGLFDPLQLGGVTIRNRLMQAAHSRIYGRDGHDSDRDIGRVDGFAAG